MKSSTCIYCGKEPKYDMDHVPPRSLFPPDLPPEIELTTAPACKICHKKNQKDDTTIRNILVSIREHENHPIIKQHLSGKMSRSLERSARWEKGDFRKLLDNIMIKEEFDKDGRSLGFAPAFELDSPLFKRFIERLSRCLLWYNCAQGYFVGEFDYKINQDIPDELYSALYQRNLLIKVHDVFAYGHTSFGRNDTAYIIAQFYGWLEFFIRIKKSNKTVRNEF